MQGGGEESEPFPGVKQGCVIAPTLFSFLFAAVLIDTFSDLDRGDYIEFRTDGKFFKLCRLQAITKVMEALLREFLFPNNCALVTHSHEDLQIIVDRLASACVCFRLTISLGHTEAMCHCMHLMTHKHLPLSSTPMKSATRVSMSSVILAAH